ncbi:hypothetical protein AB1Y20_011077 [Prymnesium parvum]|uniref:non-specific serine/threonine protein kinase n=1 Tax=Prymnesium parvum TaxID=97485 RepID=A0AB34INX4_PRYPA
MSWLGKALVQMQSLGSGFTPQTLTFDECGKEILTTSLLAEGGYSYVYAAREAGLLAGSTQYAVKKVLAQDDETRAIAETEVRLLRLVRGVPGFVRCHATLCRPLPSGAAEHWMLLEYCPHGSLVDVVYHKRGGAYAPNPPLPERRVLELLAMVAEPVAFLHSLTPAVQHRDLKLENVLGAADGTYVLCDLGSATTATLPAERTRAAALAEEERIGRTSTLMYRAPEMCDLFAAQPIGPPADLWALGCIAYALCFRSHPFLADSPLQILNASYTLPASSPYSDELHELVRSMLQRRPSERPNAAVVLRRARSLLRARRGGRAAPQKAPPPPAPPPLPTPQAEGGGKGGEDGGGGKGEGKGRGGGGEGRGEERREGGEGGAEGGEGGGGEALPRVIRRLRAGFRAEVCHRPPAAGGGGGRLTAAAARAQARAAADARLAEAARLRALEAKLLRRRGDAA